MPSFVWDRDPQEAYDNPYEYDAQQQFVREASAFLSKLRSLLNLSTLKYHRDEKTLEKARWMLANDLVDALIEIKDLIEEKRHRIASRLFRDCVETMDLLELLHSGKPRAVELLESWYENKTPPHHKAREYLKAKKGESFGKHRKQYYFDLSKFTHRTYRALNHSYSLGRDDLLVHDSYRNSRSLVLPHVISAYLAILADLIYQATKILKSTGAITEIEIENAWEEGLEKDTVPRRFVMRTNREMKKPVDD